MHFHPAYFSPTYISLSESSLERQFQQKSKMNLQKFNSDSEKLHLIQFTHMQREYKF